MVNCHDIGWYNYLMTNVRKCLTKESCSSAGNNTSFCQWSKTVTRYTFKYSVSHIAQPCPVFIYIYLPWSWHGYTGYPGPATLSSQVLASDKWKCQIKARPRISILVLVFSLIRDSEVGAASFHGIMGRRFPDGGLLRCRKWVPQQLGDVAYNIDNPAIHWEPRDQAWYLVLFWYLPDYFRHTQNS